MSLADTKCAPCGGDVPPLSDNEVTELLSEIPGWELTDSRITRTYTFKDFADALTFTNKVGALAEEEGHHPDIELTWGKVTITLFTHAIEGLSKNDFILAAKINELD